jgi:phosphatidylserine decarboxylase
MADVTIDMEEQSLEDAADQLDEADLEAGETLAVDLRNLDARTAVAFFEGALDAGYRVSLTELSAQPTGNQTIIQMIDDDEIVHIDELALELEA